MRKIKDRRFFQKSPKILAKNLLGKILVHESTEGLVSGMITEVEAYEAFIDQAAHSYIGKTKRNAVQFLDGGRVYLHMIHNKVCMDITADREGMPGSVLIRSLAPIDGIDIMINRREQNNIKNLTTGPGKLTQALGINMIYNGIDLCLESSPIYIADNGTKNFEIVQTTRIGISKSTEMLNRLYIKDNEFISRR